MKNTTCKIAIIHKLILFFKTVASSETDVAGLAQLKKEASISEITFYFCDNM